MSDPVDPRYPIGPFRRPEASTPALRATHIDTLRKLPARLRAAVERLDDAQLDTAYREGGWSVRQLVHHLGDSHMNSYVRFKLALTEDWPTVKPYDEAAWAELPDRSLQVEPSLVLIEKLHQRWVALLEAMQASDFEKGFHHPECGRQNLATALALYDWHSRHHTAHITVLCAQRGW